jgi:hypothetical protein
MNARVKLVLWGLLAVVVLLGAGWLWGASGRWQAETMATAAEQQLRLSEARAALLASRVDVFEINFGQASRHLEAARKALAAAQEHAGRDATDAHVMAIQRALTLTTEAQQLAVSVNADANSRAADAIRALDSAPQPAAAR